MIKIRYRDLSAGLHIVARSEGRRTIMYMLPGLTPGQRRAAVRRARQSARMGHGPPLPAAGVAFAVAMDQITATARNAAAAVRAHPVGLTVPAAILTSVAVFYVLVASVTVRGRPAQALGPAAAPSRGAPSQGNVPVPGVRRARGARDQLSGRAPSAAAPARTPSASPPGAVAVLSSAAPSPAPPGSSPPPGPVPPPGQPGPSPGPSPGSSPAPGPTSPGGGAFCLNLALLSLCLDH